MHIYTDSTLTLPIRIGKLAYDKVLMHYDLYYRNSKENLVYQHFDSFQINKCGASLRNFPEASLQPPPDPKIPAAGRRNPLENRRPKRHGRPRQFRPSNDDEFDERASRASHLFRGHVCFQCAFLKCIHGQQRKLRNRCKAYPSQFGKNNGS